MSALRMVVLFVAALGCGCAAVPPPPLDEDERWRTVMRSGHQLSRGSVFVPPPTLELARAVAPEDGLRVWTDPHGECWYWPASLPPGFAAELQSALRRNTGYDVSLWGESPEAGDASDYELRLTVREYRLALLDSGLGTAMATLWMWGMVHLATFYNAPDEVYLCEYEVEATLFHRRTETVAASRTLRGSKELALTDFQRGWSLYSYWPTQRLQWLSEQTELDAWRAYADSVIEACEPHARRGVAIELVRFLREQPQVSPEAEAAEEAPLKQG